MRTPGAVDGLHVAFAKQLSGFKLELELSAGREILVLFGPSGAGKTQTLNVIAGLSRPDSGEIRLDESLFFQRSDSGPFVNVPARDRRVGYVFQNYALFPHLTALENIGYSIWKRPDARERSHGLLKRMQLDGFAGRYPHELSGGQQQRIAIARAMAADPRVLLLDEPFSALDHSIRQQLHEEVCRLQEEAQLIVIYVTHNLDDALGVSHRLAVMNEGRIDQIGDAQEVIDRPASREVADILGLPNLFNAVIAGHNSGRTRLDWEGVELECDQIQAPPGNLVSAMLRPGAISIGTSDGHAGSHFKARFKRRHPGRDTARIVVELENGHEIELLAPSRYFQQNEPVTVTVSSESLYVVPPSGGMPTTPYR
jgi:molybdate transport system ATP-binding protein